VPNIGVEVFMKNFMDKNFLLHSETAKTLFEIAKEEPIFDYHCHLSPKEIYENKSYPDISALWLGGDHYKWRVLRNYDVDEKYITGDSSSFLSYPRHEYFRRILCDLLGEMVENGEYPADMDTLAEIVKGISFGNAIKYFGIQLSTI
jgi:glucuronate isomerase